MRTILTREVLGLGVALAACGCTSGGADAASWKEADFPETHASLTSDAGGAPAPAQPSSVDAGSPALPLTCSDAGTGSDNACAPQRARSSGQDCVRVEGYAWNGADCDAVICGCTGADCGALYASAEACTGAYRACIAPATVCSGLPWYQCADHCPADWNLAGGGRSFGECAGDCSMELTLVPPSAPTGGSCTGTVLGQLVVKNTQGEPDRFVELELSHDAFAEAMRLSRAIADLALPPVSGCPDCLDQGRAWFTRQRAGSSAELFAYEFGTYRVPPVLSGVDQFLQQLIVEANLCRGPLLHRCVTTPVPFGGAHSEPHCGLSRPDSPPCVP